MKIAMVHDWLAFIGGAEKTLLEMLRCFPQADLFVLVDGLSAKERQLFLAINPQLKIIPSFIHRLPFAQKKFEYYLPLMPLAVEQWDLRGYDVVISSSHAFAKGVITAPDQLHISYVHSPMRYAWDMQFAYLEASPNMSRGVRGMLARLGLHYLRLWDWRTVPSVDVWVSNSHFIRRRIKKCYGQTAQVIYPPVEMPSLPHSPRAVGDYYVTCSRLVEYKRIDLIVQAFIEMAQKQSNLLPRRLLIIGEGPMRARLQKMAQGHSYIKFCGKLDDEAMRQTIASAQAFIFSAKEDFGIAPLEAQSLGVPVIAYGRGGALETVRDIHQSEPTGIWFPEQTSESLIAAIDRFENASTAIQPQHCRAYAEQFSTQRFHREFTQAVQSAWDHFIALKND